VSASRVAVKLQRLRTVDALREHLAELGIELPLDEQLEAGPASPLARPLDIGKRTLGNRFAILPMEGWDAGRDGRPTDLVRRRWRRFRCTSMHAPASAQQGWMTAKLPGCRGASTWYVRMPG